MRTLRSSIYSLIVVIVLMVAVIGLSLRLAYFASKLLPVVIASMVLLLAVIDLVMEIKAEHSPKAPETAAKTGAGGKTGVKASKYFRYVSWLVGFSLAIYMVGFLIAIPLFVGAYMKRHGSHWLGTVTTAILYTGIIYAVFDLALKADLYKGKLLMWLGF
jgi:bacteriorhodopsin